MQAFPVVVYEASTLHLLVVSEAKKHSWHVYRLVAASLAFAELQLSALVQQSVKASARQPVRSVLVPPAMASALKLPLALVY